MVPTLIVLLHGMSHTLLCISNKEQSSAVAPVTGLVTCLETAVQGQGGA